MCSSDLSKGALGWYERAAEQGHAEAHFRLGLLHSREDSLYGDRAAAVRHFEAAAERGDARAQYALAQALYAGRGAEPAPERAVDWLRRSALQGYHRAQARLADLYATGRNIEHDEASAIAWLRLASEQHARLYGNALDALERLATEEARELAATREHALRAAIEGSRGNLETP